MRNQASEASRWLPAVVPVVLYNGTAPWRAPQEVGELILPVGERLAPYQPSQRYVVVDEQHVADDAVPAGNLMRAVIGLEQSRTPADLTRITKELEEWLAGAENAGLRGVFVDWLRSAIAQVTPAGEALPAMNSLAEVTMTLEERIKEWPAQWMRQGLERGLEQGREQGLEQGLEHERELLRSMAARRFGAETAERLAALLSGVADADHLTEAGDWLVRCADGDEFLARVEQIAAS